MFQFRDRYGSGIDLRKACLNVNYACGVQVSCEVFAWNGIRITMVIFWLHMGNVSN